MNVFTFSLVELMFAVFSPPIAMWADDSVLMLIILVLITTQPFAINQYHSSTEWVDQLSYTIRIPSVITKGNLKPPHKEICLGERVGWIKKTVRNSGKFLATPVFISINLTVFLVIVVQWTKWVTF